MAALYISEYAGQTFSGLEAAVEPCLTDQTPVAVGGAAQSAAFGVNTRLIRVHTDAICSIKIGENPTATTNNKRMAANDTEYFVVQPGHKLSVIANT